MAGFRLNTEEDADIIKDLNRFKNKSKRIKDLLRKGLEYENTLIKLTNRSPITEADVANFEQFRKASSEPLQWHIPSEPTVKPKNHEPGGLKANILKNDF